MDHHGRFVKLRDGLAQEVLERIRTDAAAVPWPLKGLLLELAKDLFNPQLHIGQVWQRLRQKDHSLSSRFACRLGPTPKDYLEERRMEVAAKLLGLPGLKASVEVVGQLVGYSSVRWFQRVFLRRFGVTAGEYRRHGGMPPAKPETDLSMLSTDEIKKRLSAEVAKINPALAEASWVEVLYGGFPFSTPLLFEQLLELSRELGRRDRQIGIKLAENAVASLEQLRGKLPEAEIAALEARGWAWVGNARRLAYDFWAAETAFEHAIALLPVGHFSQIEAEVFDLLGYLRFDQRRLPEALELINRALSLCRVAGKSKLLVEILLDRAQILRLQGDAASAISALKEAASLVEPESEPFLALTVLQNLTLTEVQVGSVDEALARLPAVKALSQRVEHPQAVMQIVWLEGLIHATRGSAGQASELLGEARKGFLKLSDTGNAAIIALDLAEQYLNLGRAAEAGALASEALAFFEGLALDQEAMTAVYLLRQALATHQLSVAALRQARENLERSRHWTPPIGLT